MNIQYALMLIILTWAWLNGLYCDEYSLCIHAMVVWAWFIVLWIFTLQWCK